MGCARLLGTQEEPWIGFICGADVVACTACGVYAEYLCDWPMGKGKTCDAPLCGRHAISQGFPPDNQPRLFGDPDPETEIHYCPTHAAMAGRM